MTEWNALPVAIIGVGDAGGLALNTLIEKSVTNVTPIAINTSNQSLMRSKAPIRVQLGKELLKGSGAGGDPALGKQAAEASIDELYEVLPFEQTVYIVAGMGGGTGAGAVSVIAQVAQKQQNRTVAILSLPFSFEGEARMKIAMAGLRELPDRVNELIVIENDALLFLSRTQLTEEQAFKLVEEALAWRVIHHLLPNIRA